jgi:hypothetical protein
MKYQRFISGSDQIIEENIEMLSRNYVAKYPEL